MNNASIIWKNKLILIYLIVSPFLVNGQILNSRNIYAGLYYGRVEAKMHSIGFSLGTDSDKRLQYEISLHHSRDFRSLGYRYSYTIEPSINFYFKKRNENSKRLYLKGSLNLFAQYYTRNYELFSLQRTEAPFKRYGYGLLPGLNLFFNLNHRFKLTSSIISGPAFYTSYGPECDKTNGLECYEHSPIHYSDLTTYVYFGILLKL